MGQECCQNADNKQNELTTNIEDNLNRNSQGEKNRTSNGNHEVFGTLHEENDDDKEKNCSSAHDHSQMIASLTNHINPCSTNLINGSIAEQKTTDKMFDQSEQAKLVYDRLGPLLDDNENPNLFDANNGKLQGPFIFEDESTYIGQLDYFNNRHGYGSLVTKTGSIYEGQFSNNWFNGAGRLIQNSGDYLMTNFKNGLVEGQGETYNRAGQQIMRANWENNQLSGQGEEWAFDNNKYYKQYKGDYKNDMKNGMGIFYWPDESYYEGYFTDNDMNIFGKYTWPNNKTWIGEWLNNAISGWGQMKWPDGKIFFGYYQNDLRNGYGEMKQTTGTIIKSYWKNNKNTSSTSYIIKADGTIIKRTYTTNNQKQDQEIDISDIPNDFGKEMKGININTLKKKFNMADLED